MQIPIEQILFLDFETFSTIPIKYGTYKYMEKVEGLLLAYAVGATPVRVWDMTKDGMPPLLYNEFKRKDLYFCAHNARFDRNVLERTLGVYHDKWICTRINACRHSLPGSLAELCSVYKLPQDKAKSKRGKQLIQLFCKPLGKNRKLKRATRFTHPRQWKEFIEYARLDITAMREIYKKMPSWNCTPYDNKIWEHDTLVNSRGFKINIPFVNKVVTSLEEEKKANNDKTYIMTQTQVKAATQRDELLKYMCNTFGIDLPDLTKSTLQRRLDNPDLPEALRDLIHVRLQSAKVSTRKYATLLNSVSSDGILRGVLGYRAARRTGRFNSSIFQMHNMMRPDKRYKKLDAILEGIDAIMAGCADLLYPEVNVLCSSLLRSVIIPRKGKKIVASDFSSVEGRGLAWLAGEEWKIKAYEDYDKGLTPYDMYEMTYAKTFNVDPMDVGEDERQQGKVLELFGGYGGGFGAAVTFGLAYGLDLDAIAKRTTLPGHVKHKAENYYNYCLDEYPGRIGGFSAETFITWDGIKRMWREANPKIEQFWYDLENAMRKAIRYKEKTQVGYITVDRQGAWLRMRLPSGRYLCYPSPKLVGNTITYMGLEKYQWKRVSTYGGKAAENDTQAVCCDGLTDGLLEAEAHNYNVIGHVHDEGVTEAPDTSEYSPEGLSEHLCRWGSWSRGFPIAAKGFEGYCYRKD